MAMWWCFCGGIQPQECHGVQENQGSHCLGLIIQKLWVRDIPQHALRLSFGDDSYDDWQLRIRFVLHHGEFATLGSVRINEKIRFQSMVLLGVPIVWATLKCKSRSLPLRGGWTFFYRKGLPRFTTSGDQKLREPIGKRQNRSDLPLY